MMSFDDGGRDKHLCPKHETWSDSGSVCPECLDRYEQAKRLKKQRRAERTHLYGFFKGLGEVYKVQAGI